jgi:hypothetical protein
VEPAEAVPERHVVAHCDAQAAHLVVRVPEDRKDVRPVLQLRFDPDVLQRRLDVEGHDVCRVYRPQALEILGPDSLGDPGHLLLDLGLVRLALGIHR